MANGTIAVVVPAYKVAEHIADVLRQILHRFDKGHARMLHQEANGIAVFAAAKAMEKLFGRADRKRRRLLAVERAQPHEIGPAFFELHIAAHHLDNVDAG